MWQSLKTIGLIIGVIVSAWFRFDVESIGMSWSVLVICLAAMIAVWIAEAKRVPKVEEPSGIRELGSRDELTAEEEKQLVDALRTWHAQQQRDAAAAERRERFGSRENWARRSPLAARRSRLSGTSVGASTDNTGSTNRLE